nr:hypothetical protein [Tanacetum cinerariifolium]
MMPPLLPLVKNDQSLSKITYPKRKEILEDSQCLIRTMPVKNALADLGASINLMPHSFFLKLGILELKPTKMSIQLDDRVTFNIGKSMKFASSQDDCLYFADHTDKKVQEQLDDTLDPDHNWIDNEEKARPKRFSDESIMKMDFSLEESWFADFTNYLAVKELPNAKHILHHYHHGPAGGYHGANATARKVVGILDLMRQNE